MKKLLPVFLLAFSCSAMAEWVEFSSMPNGDVYFYDNSRLETDGSQISLWTRVRYKTSIMGASSYQSFSRLDCSENSETTLQSTFYSDKNWNKQAMATNMKPKPKKLVVPDSAMGLLIDILCKT